MTSDDSPPGRHERHRSGESAEPAATTNATARQVIYSVNLEVDHKALRAQVFNEGWRLMKNRFYDAKMHGADWPAVRTMYEPLLEHLVDEEELHPSGCSARRSPRCATR